MIDKEQINRFKALLEQDNTNNKDNERKSLFWLISGCEILYNTVDSIYDFKDHSIKHECLENIAFSSAEYSLIKLGFNLYNSHNKSDIDECLYTLDNTNFELAIESIRYSKLDENLENMAVL